MKRIVSVLSVLVFMVVGGVPTLTPSAQAQNGPPPPPTIDKECEPDPIQRGQRFTCTIDVEAAPGTAALVRVTDTLPAGVTPTTATRQLGSDGPAQPCTVTDRTVSCPEESIINAIPEVGQAFALTVTIDATAEQCGTFQNTATAEGIAINVGSTPDDPTPYTVTDTEDISVVGCVPTTKEQCKKGGWRDFGYPDQGTCISAVNQNRP
jgi:hypothetical protein